jgi:hypothetical protein
MKRWITGLLVRAVIVVGASLSQAFAEPVQWSQNGHFYEAFAVSGGISWSDAKANAIAKGGYLATITSAEENAFVFSVAENVEYWYIISNMYGSAFCGPWLGGYQSDGAAEPSGGWGWITGESLDYTNWWTGQPDNRGGAANENKMHLYSRGTSPADRAPYWNDTTDDDMHVQSYLVEYAGSEPSFLPGDANRDWTVNVVDLTLLLNNYNKTGMVWADGDFNGDATVNAADLTALLNNYNKTYGAGVVAGTAVPEPGSLAMLAGIALTSSLYGWRKQA